MVTKFTDNEVSSKQKRVRWDPSSRFAFAKAFFQVFSQQEVLVIVQAPNINRIVTTIANMVLSRINK
jgi:hypothetical protein